MDGSRQSQVQKKEHNSKGKSVDSQERDKPGNNRGGGAGAGQGLSVPALRATGMWAELVPTHTTQTLQERLHKLLEAAGCHGRWLPHRAPPDREPKCPIHGLLPARQD